MPTAGIEIERRVGSGSFVSERTQRLPGRGKARARGRTLSRQRWLRLPL